MTPLKKSLTRIQEQMFLVSLKVSLNLGKLIFKLFLLEKRNRNVAQIYCWYLTAFDV